MSEATCIRLIFMDMGDLEVFFLNRIDFDSGRHSQLRFTLPSTAPFTRSITTVLHAGAIDETIPPPPEIRKAGSRILVRTPSRGFQPTVKIKRDGVEAIPDRIASETPRRGISTKKPSPPWWHGGDEPLRHLTAPFGLKYISLQRPASMEDLIG